MASTLAGARSWQRWIARTAGGLPLLFLLSCLVTDHPEYGEPNVPAHLVRIAPHDFDRASPDTRLCMGTKSWMPFQVAVSDANVDDSLEARIYVNGRWLSDRNVEIKKTGKAERLPPLLMCAAQEDFDSPCNLVEIRVSRRFALNNVYLPAELGDLSIVRWWILDESSDEPTARPADCAVQEQRDGGPP
jgi:hypothetical protein